MKLKLDENLGRRCVDILTDAGHDVATVFAEGLAGATDHDVLDRCRKEQRCLVTLDLDFANPLVFLPSDYCGLAVLRLPSTPALVDLHQAAGTLVRALKSASIDGQLWIVQRDRIRQYQPEQ